MAGEDKRAGDFRIGAWWQPRGLELGRGGGATSKMGHRALAVDLPGRGENPYDLAKITLKLHIDVVSEFIEQRDLRDVVLVGHSMAGLIIPNVAVRMPQRIKRLIFVSALVMHDGEAATDVFRPIGEAAATRAKKGEQLSMAERFRRYQMQ